MLPPVTEASTHPVVSVIMPAFNANVTLAPAIKSVLSQTFTEFELIVVDDCSTDSTADQAASLAHVDTRIKALSTASRQGAAVARNLAVEAASGKYLALLDADDIALPTRFAVQVQILENNPSVQIVASDAYAIDVHGNHLGDIKCRPGRLSHGDFLRGSPFVNSTAMIRRSVFEGLGGYDPRFSRCEDFDFWLRCSAVLPPGAFFYVRTPLVEYRTKERNLPVRDLVFSVQALWLQKTPLRKRVEDIGIFAALNLLSHSKQFLRRAARKVIAQMVPWKS